ncbi:MAG: histidinol dehydrogenase [Myxococcales bacterium]|nr:histidinol dehydrogenase [Myxococcales bacterium]
MTLLRVVSHPSAELEKTLTLLERRGENDLDRVEPSVREVLAAVRLEGDSAVRRFVQKFEGRSPDSLLIRDYGGAAALASLEPALAGALTEAAARIRVFHQRQAARGGSFEYEEAGIRLGTRERPLKRVGVYAPGGKARYPSSVLMCAIIAQVAGVEQIIVATPDAAPEVRAACHLAGVDAILDAGGAQAIAALAYGTETLPRVDKIVGPGNIYVAAAKRLVFGEVDIDSIAGPSEILVLADESADADVVAADLLSQAEHDEAAYPLLLTTHAALVPAVEQALAVRLADLPRRVIAEASIREKGVALVVPDLDTLTHIANRLAAEHVALHVREPRALADRVTHAGALFIGAMTPEAAGDYVAGPSHVLPTGGAARYGSPLGIYDFVARTSIIEYSREALAQAGSGIEALARAEGLHAHARAVSVRTARTSKT